MRPQPRYNPGDRIGGRYRVHKALMGGMGEVYLCLDEQDRLTFALKTFQRRYFDSDTLRKSFENEVQSWIALEKHTNIVRCHYMTPVDNTPFVFLEWVAGHPSKGTSLREWLRHGPLDLKTALEVTIGILRGLRHADAKSPGIVHRDLKPDNILMLEDGTPKITDFGLAKSVSKAEDVTPDAETESGGFGGSMRVGEVVGTPPYMPPEQWRGEIPDFRADVYAVGCILYEMLNGQMAFPVPAGVTTQSEYIRRLRDMHSAAERPTLPDTFPAELNERLQVCLAPDTADHPGTLNALLDQLSAIYQDHIGSAPAAERPAGTLAALEYNNRGGTFANLKEYERAIADYDEAIRLDPTDAPAYSNRGTSYFKMGQFERAIADYDEAIRLDPTLAQAYSNRGVSYSNLDQSERAIADYDEAIRLDPTDAPAYSNRGNSYSKMGQSERAIADYDEAIRLDPTLAQAYLNKAVALAKLNQLQEAIQAGEQAARLGAPRANELLNIVRQMMGQEPAQTVSNDPQAAFEAFQGASSPDAMRQTVQQFPVLAQMVPTIEQVIREQVPPEARPAFQQRLAWLQQIVDEGK